MGQHDELFERLRVICMAFPEAEEEPFGGHTTPSWRINKKFFAMGRDGDGRESVWFKAPPGAQEVLVSAAPGRFYRPPYVGSKGWAGAWLDIDDVDWDELVGLIDQSYRMTAPKRLVKLLDTSAPA
jgi:predicted DNA-binding protein (MmcQ/YjbR family)